MESLIIIAVLPVFLIGMYIYAKDKDKEPKSLLLKMLLGGIGSALLCIFLNGIISYIIPSFDNFEKNANLIELIFYVFIGIALLEEGCKWFFAYKLSFNNKEFDEFYDMIIYCVFVALGFALFENIFYVLKGGYIVGISRAIFAVPGHACDGIFMGYFLGLAKIYQLNKNYTLMKKNIALSIIIPTLMHGIYDYLVIAKQDVFLVLFLFLVVVMYIIAIKRVNKAVKINQKFYKTTKYCPNCGKECSGNFCGNCGKKLN